MLGWQHPWMLAGLIAAGIPVVIHLLTRARARIIKLPTFHLLVDAGGGKQALHRLRTWLVLLLRTLLIAALVLVFASPYQRQRADESQDGDARRVVVVVDASMSMNASQSGVTQFAQSRAAAADLLRSLPSGTRAAVIYSALQPRAALPALSTNLTYLHDHLAQSQPTLESGHPLAALQLAQQMLSGRGDVFIFSDFQRTEWASLNFADFPQMRFHLHVTSQTIGNVGITSVELSPDNPVLDENVELSCTVFNATAQRRVANVRLNLPGHSADREVQLAPYSSSQATFTFRAAPAGIRTGYVSLSPDALEADNTRYFRINVSQTLPVLMISDHDPGDTHQAPFFITSALSPSPEVTTGLQLVHRRSQETDIAALESAELLCLVSPVKLTGRVLEVVARRVLEGTPLICMLDGPDAGDMVNGLIGTSEGRIRPPYDLLRPVDAAQDAAHIGFVTTSHGPLQVLDGPQQGDITAWTFARYWHTRTDPARQSEVLATYEDGSAALSLTPAGRGTVVFLNLPIAPTASNAVGSPLFPILLHELIRHLRHHQHAMVNTPGRPWSIDVLGQAQAEDTDPVYQLVGSDQSVHEAVVVSRGRSDRLSLPPVSQPGPYLVQRDQRQVDVAVVNVDGRETDTRSIDLARWQDQPDGAPINVAIMRAEKQTANPLANKPWWPTLLMIAACAMLGEMLILAFWRTHSLEPHRGK